jgi:two-component system cell cycle sensor histidine kinase/response regulator CckA
MPENLTPYLAGLSLALSAACLWLLRLQLQQKSQLRETERFQSIFDAASVGMFLCGADGRFMDINPAAEAVLGCAKKALIGQPYQTAGLVSAEDLPRLLELHMRNLAGEPTGPDAFAAKAADGSAVYFELCTQVLVLHSQSLVLGVVHDVTRRQLADEAEAKLKAQLSQAQRMESIGRLAAGVAHDFSNLITVIRTHLYLAGQNANLSASTTDSIRRADQAALQAGSLTRQLLAFSRRQVIAPRALDLNALLPGVSRALQPQAGPQVELRTFLAPGLGLVKADPAQVEQMLAHLVANARDALPQGGRVLLETADVDLHASDCERLPGATPGAWVMLAVSDNGAGLTQEQKARIFEPFYSSKAGHGAGLGLSMVYGAARQHGGFVEVRSEPGQGCSFRVYFPRIEGDVPLPQSPAAQALGDMQGHELLLFVEDDTEVRMATVRVLERLGYGVLAAENVQTAQALMAQHGPNVKMLLADMDLPDGNGRDLARGLRESNPSLSLLYTSGYAEPDLTLQCLTEEGALFLPKPFTPEALALAVRQALAMPIKGIH